MPLHCERPSTYFTYRSLSNGNAYFSQLFCKSLRPPTVSDLMHTPSSSSSIERLASSSADAMAALRSSSEFTTLRVVPTRTPSNDGALILTPAAA